MTLVLESVARTLDQGLRLVPPDIDIQAKDGRIGYRFPAVVNHAEEGGYVASVPWLPSAYSQGETVAEALERVREAAAGVIKFYSERAQDIPWEIPPELYSVEGEVCRWIVVYV